MLSEKQEEAIRLLVYENKKQREVADIIGVHESTVSKWKREESYAKKFQEEIENKFRALVSKAISRMESVLDNEDSHSAALNAAKYILDYSGFKATEKQEVKHEGLSITIDYGDNSGGDAECQKE